MNGIERTRARKEKKTEPRARRKFPAEYKAGAARQVLDEKKSDRSRELLKNAGDFFAKQSE